MDKTSDQKLRRWEVWQRQDGTTYLTWGTKAQPVETEKLVSTFYSANWLSAEREAFGTEPEIDDGVQPLVEIMHLFAGVMTMAACQGHPERGDDCAILGLTFDDTPALKTLSAALCEVARRRSGTETKWRSETGGCRLDAGRFLRVRLRGLHLP